MLPHRLRARERRNKKKFCRSAIRRIHGRLHTSVYLGTHDTTCAQRGSCSRRTALPNASYVRVPIEVHKKPQTRKEAVRGEAYLSTAAWIGRATEHTTAAAAAAGAAAGAAGGAGAAPSLRRGPRSRCLRLSAYVCIRQRRHCCCCCSIAAIRSVTGATAATDCCNSCERPAPAARAYTAKINLNSSLMEP